MADDERGFAADLWSELAALGWTGVLVPEEQGGLGLGLVDAVVVHEEMGRVPFPGPFFSSAMQATMAARRLGAFDLLEPLADGSRRGTVALDELGHGDPVDRIRSRSRRKGADWVLTGLKPLVLDGHTADWVIIAARTQEGLGSFLIENPEAVAVPTMDPTRKAARLVLEETVAIPLGPIGDHHAIWLRIADDSSVALAAELVGCAKPLEMAVDYSKARVQFDKPIATHQVIQHKIVDMLHKLESVGSACTTAWTSDVEDEHRCVPAAIAKSSMAEAVFITAENIQVHGAVGFTWESGAQLFYKRAKQNDTLLGYQGWQRQRIADRPRRS
jgi:alkylation response protein AidB-like acyl-CoA dehydrogenase